jgi:hypothetical protein
MKKGSACVEAFREISHLVANFFGDPDRARRSKEISFQLDLRALVEDMIRLKLHAETPRGRHVPAPPEKKASKEPHSAIMDPIVEGAEIWQTKFKQFITATTFDPALGYPVTQETSGGPRDARLETGTVFDNIENPITHDDYEDMHGDEIGQGGLGAGSLGGGDEFGSGIEAV